jgi:hypothetical protein
MKRIHPAAALLALLFALPADAAATVTRASGLGFTAAWGFNEACPVPEEGGRLMTVLLTFTATTTDGVPAAFLELHAGNDCSPDPLPLPLDAFGVIQDGSQQFVIDDRGASGLGFATYQAEIPVVVEGNDCVALAQVNVRLDAVSPLRRERNLSRANEDGSFLLEFTDRISRPAAPSGSITLLDPLGCVDDRVPTEFAVSPQVVDRDTGAVASEIFRTRDLTITHTRP